MSFKIETVRDIVKLNRRNITQLLSDKSIVFAEKYRIATNSSEINSYGYEIPVKPTLENEHVYITFTQNPGIENVVCTIFRTNKEPLKYHGLHIGNGIYELTSSYNAKIKLVPEEEGKFIVYYSNSVDKVYSVSKIVPITNNI